MLLGSALLPGAKADAAALPAFMEICTPQGIVLKAFGDPAEDSPGPEPGDRGWQDCPLCSASEQGGLGLPAGLAVIGPAGAVDQAVAAAHSIAERRHHKRPQTRAPPSAE